ncbi:zinc/iron-chelating domain-containing protein [Thermocladium modestius]|uniref:Zinc/iron-chelating domain-containing protein n=1 Tax=Thermocladium modestius TaxID=62609 RepID=A0A830GVU4_9CREN|nr:YkgJ family cysteine cluster protein [Thermocladium modestius]GGP19300.1 zinc/iron-chelating domain-containing protein [Thermocladium modestius]
MVREFRCEPNCALCCKLSPITVLPHEVYLLQNEAEELGVRPRFVPSYMVADQLSGVRIALSYLLLLDEEGKCPFLRGTKCSVHDKYKPLTCKSFPYLPRIIRYTMDASTKTIDFDTSFAASYACPVVKRDDPSHGNGDLRIYFRNEAPSAQEAIYLRKFYAATLTQMWRNGMIELVDPSDGLPPYPVVNGYSFIRQRLPMLTLSALDIIQLNNKDE